MDKITQQNAALVEEAAAAAKSMEEQTEELAQIVSAFQIGAAPVAAPVAARAATGAVRPVPGRASSAAVHSPAKVAKKAPANRQPAAGSVAEDDWKEF